MSSTWFNNEDLFNCNCSWMAEWFRCSTHGRKAWDGTGSIPGGGWSVMKANTEGIVWGKKEKME